MDVLWLCVCRRVLGLPGLELVQPQHQAFVKSNQRHGPVVSVHRADVAYFFSVRVQSRPPFTPRLATSQHGVRRRQAALRGAERRTLAGTRDPAPRISVGKQKSREGVIITSGVAHAGHARRPGRKTRSPSRGATPTTKRTTGPGVSRKEKRSSPRRRALSVHPSSQSPDLGRPRNGRAGAAETAPMQHLPALGSTAKPRNIPLPNGTPDVGRRLKASGLRVATRRPFQTQVLAFKPRVPRTARQCARRQRPNEGKLGRGRIVKTS